MIPCRMLISVLFTLCLACPSTHAQRTPKTDVVTETIGAITYKKVIAPNRKVCILKTDTTGFPNYATECTGNDSLCQVWGKLEVARIEAIGVARKKALGTCVVSPQADSIKRMRKRIADGWDIKTLNTGAHLYYLDGWAKEIILETNMVRTNPKKYAQWIRTFFTPEGIRTNKKIGSLMRTLETMEPVALVVPEKNLCLVSLDNVIEMKKQNRDFHPKITRKHGMLEVSENAASYNNGSYVDPQQMVFEWLWDDKNMTPENPVGHRENILNSRWRYIGSARVRQEVFSSYQYYESQTFASQKLSP